MTTELAQVQPLDRHPAAVYLSSLSASGRRTMLSKLGTVAEVFGASDPFAVPWSDMRFQHLAVLRTRLQERGLAPATVNSTLYAVRGVLRAARNLGLLSAEDHDMLREVKPVAGTRELSGRALSQGEIERLLKACRYRRGPGGTRDAALIGLLYATGLRRSEVVGLDLEHYDPESGRLVVIGKGDKQRTVFVAAGAADLLGAWLEVRGPEPGPLFVPIDKQGRITVRRLTDQAIYNTLRRRGRQARIPRFSPHDLRRSFVSDLLDAGADIVTVQQLAGHASPTTTARYDRRGEEAKRKAVALLRIPT